MRFEISRHAGALLLTFAFLWPAIAVADNPKAVVLALESAESDAALAAEIVAIVVAEAQQTHRFSLVDAVDTRLSEIALVLACNPSSPSCVRQVASQLKANIVIYGALTRTRSGEVQLDLTTFDTVTGREITTMRSPAGATGESTRPAIAEYFRGQSTTATLRVSASVAGAQVRIDGKFAGVAPLERKGINPGTVTIQVAHPNYQVWEASVPLRAGANPPVWAQLVAIDAENGPTSGPTDPDVVTRDSPRRVNWPAWTTVALGAAALGTSAGLAVSMQSTRATLESESAAGTLSEERFRTLYMRGKNVQLAHRVLLGVGFATTATGIVWLLLSRSDSGDTSSGASLPLISAGLTAHGLTARIKW